MSTITTPETHSFFFDKERTQLSVIGASDAHHARNLAMELINSNGGLPENTELSAGILKRCIFLDPKPDHWENYYYFQINPIKVFNQ